MFYPTDTPRAPDKDDQVSALLGLSPLLVMTTNVVDALSLALAAFVALVVAGVLVASIRRWINQDVRWPALMLVIGLCTSTVTLLSQALVFDLYQRVSFVVPILLTNWLVLARLDRASHGRLHTAESMTAAFGASAALVVVGAICETIGDGTLLAGAAPLPAIRFADSGFPFAAMAPGAFIIAGLLLAARNVYTQRT